MNRSEFIAMAKDVHKHPEHLADYRKIYKNVYPFSDGIFKMLMANEAKPERTVKFLNAMLGLTGDKAIKTYTLGVPENPGVLNDKTAIFDIYGTTQAGEPVLIEVQQNFNTLFVDRLIYYTARVISRTVKKANSRGSVTPISTTPNSCGTIVCSTASWTSSLSNWRNSSQSKIAPRPRDANSPTGPKCCEFSAIFLKTRISPKKN